MILAILVAWFAYKKASTNGRNGILWAVVGLVLFIGVQFLVSIVSGVALVFLAVIFGWSDFDIESTTYTWPIYLAAIVASVGASLLLLKFLDSPAKGFTPAPQSNGPLGL